jgi:hypothetical protein
MLGSSSTLTPSHRCKVGEGVEATMVLARPPPLARDGITCREATAALPSTILCLLVAELVGRLWAEHVQWPRRATTARL